MASYLKFIFTVVAYSIANVYTIVNVSCVNQTIPSTVEVDRDNVGPIDVIPELLLRMFLAYVKDDQRLKRSTNHPKPTVHGFVGEASSDHNATVFRLTDSKLGMDECILSAKLRVMVKTTRSFAHNTHLVLFDQNTHRPMYTADFDGDGERSIVLPVRSLVHKWILSERPHQGVYFKLSSDNRVATNSSVQVIEGSGFQKRRNRPLLIVKTLPTKTKLFEDMESLIKKLIQRSRRPRAVVRDEGPCSRRSMTVQFRKHLNIKDIIFPPSFESYRCGGHCKFPLDNKVNPTRYAIVLAILYSRFGLAGGGKEPCCVPTKLRKVTVFVKRQGHVKIQSYDDMIVEECGCR